MLHEKPTRVYIDFPSWMVDSLDKEQSILVLFFSSHKIQKKVSDIVTEIFAKYGLSAFIFTVVVFFLIWFIAHWATSPEKEVSVLWGLVKYTKAPNVTDIVNPSLNSSNADLTHVKESEKHSYSPLSLITLNDITLANMDSVLTILRKKRGLRELTAMESGKKISELPKETYFYMSSYFIYPTKNLTVQEQILDYNSERYRTQTSSAEIHNMTNDGLHVIGFASEADASRVSQLSGQKLCNIIVTPTPWGQLTSLISIPISRIITLKCRNAQDNSRYEHSILDIEIK